MRFAPPQPADPLNDGSYRFDGSYATYLTSWFNKVCPQAGPNLKNSWHAKSAEVAADAELNDSQKAMFEAQQEEFATKSMIGTEDCLNLAVFTPKVLNSKSFHFEDVKLIWN